MGLVVAFAITMVTSGLSNLAFASNNGNTDCSERRLTDGCTPGQHINEKRGKVVGNPHYECCGSDGKGDPHDEGPNPDKGDPHFPLP